MEENVYSKLCAAAATVRNGTGEICLVIKGVGSYDLGYDEAGIGKATRSPDGQASKPALTTDWATLVKVRRVPLTN